MHIIDLKTLTTAIKAAINLPLYSLIVFLNQTYSPLTYVKSARHIVPEITNHEEY